jgi:hypothetical protein
MPSPSHSKSSSTSVSSSSGPRSRRSSKQLSNPAEKSKDAESQQRCSSTHSRNKSRSSTVSRRSRADSGSLECPAGPVTAGAGTGAGAGSGATTAGATEPQRPPLISRAYSAPLIPNGAPHSPTTIDRPNGYDKDVLGPVDSADEEIADDPFFQRYSLPHAAEDEELAINQIKDRIDRILSPAGSTTAAASSIPPQAKPDTTNDLTSSPTSPRSPRYVRPCPPFIYFRMACRNHKLIVRSSGTPVKPPDLSCKRSTSPWLDPDKLGNPPSYDKP